MIQPGRKKNEFKAICELTDRYSYEGSPIFIAERGFSSFNFFAHAMEKGIFFLVRAKYINVKRLLNLEEFSDNLDTDVDIILTRTQSKKKRNHPELNEQYRYISSEVAFDYIEPKSTVEYSMHFQIIRFEVAKGIYENIITNLPVDEFSPDEIKHLYNLRWSIEISFRDLKHTIGTLNFH